METDSEYFHLNLRTCSQSRPPETLCIQQSIKPSSGPLCKMATLPRYPNFLDPSLAFIPGCKFWLPTFNVLDNPCSTASGLRHRFYTAYGNGNNGGLVLVLRPFCGLSLSIWKRGILYRISHCSGSIGRSVFEGCWRPDSERCRGWC